MNQIITAQELRAKLSQGPVNFKFIKSDGTERVANGTTNMSNVPESQHPKGGKAPDSIIAFYDLDKQAWRSLSISSTIWI